MPEAKKGLNPRVCAPMGMNSPLTSEAFSPLGAQIKLVAVQPFGLFVQTQNGQIFEHPLPLQRTVNDHDVTAIQPHEARGLTVPSALHKWVDVDQFVTGKLPTLIVEDHAHRMNPEAQAQYARFLEQHIEGLNGEAFSAQKAYEAAVKYVFSHAQGTNPLLALPLMDALGTQGTGSSAVDWAQSQIAAYARNGLAQQITPVNGMSESARTQSSSLFHQIIADVLRCCATAQHLELANIENAIPVDGPLRKVALASMFYGDRIQAAIVKLELPYQFGDLWTVGIGRAYSGLETFCQENLSVPSPFRLP